MVETTRFEITISLEMQKRIAEWRRTQEDLPNRTEAIRRLIEIGLSSPETASVETPIKRGARKRSSCLRIEGAMMAA